MQNVVVVSQPSTVPTTRVIEAHPHANDFLVLTVVMMVVCFFCGNLLAYICLVPALIFSIMVSVLYRYSVCMYMYCMDLL